MSPGSTTMLLFSSLLLLCSTGTLALSAGQPCNVNVPSQCDSGLVCVAQGTDAYCRSSSCPATCPELTCSSALQYVPTGQCCPTCLPPPTTRFVQPSGCTVNGVHHNEGDRWQSDDYCTSCSCVSGQPLCSAVACHATCSNPVPVEGQCCPICPETTVVSPPLTSISDHCVENGKEYADGEDWRPAGADSCLRARCDGGQILRYSFQCEPPSCSDPVQFDDVCCPVCLRSSQSNADESGSTSAPPTCTLSNDMVLQDGEKHCPAPNVTATCNAGTVEYTHHCPPLDCVTVIRGLGDCDCPICVDNAPRFVVAGRLHMSLFQYIWKAEATDEMIRQLAHDSGLHSDHNIFSTCNGIICFKMNVLSPNMTATERDVVTAVKKEVRSKSHSGLDIGYVREFFTEKRFARSVVNDDSDSVYDTLSLSSSSSSTSSSDQHTSVIIAVGVSSAVLGVVATVVGVALLASFVRRKHSSRSTITV